MSGSVPWHWIKEDTNNYKLIRGKTSVDPILATVIKLSPVANRKIVINEARNCSLSVVSSSF